MPKYTHFTIRRKREFKVKYPDREMITDGNTNIERIDQIEETNRPPYQDPVAVRRIMKRNFFDIVLIKTNSWKNSQIRNDRDKKKHTNHQKVVNHVNRRNK